jgi:hypothetical protein
MRPHTGESYLGDVSQPRVLQSVPRVVP